MKFRVALILGLICVMVTSLGCSGVTPLGRMGDTMFYSVHAAHLDGPNITALVAVKDGEAKVVQSFAGPGLATVVAPAAVTAAGEMGAANTFGANLKPNKVNVSAAGSGGSGGAGGSASGGDGGSVDQSKRSSLQDNRIDNSVRTSTDNRTNNVNIGK